MFGKDSVIRDVSNKMDYLVLKFTAGYDYYDILDEFGSGGDFEGWQVASEADLNLLGNSAGIVHGSTDSSILAKAEQLRDWFGNVGTSSTYIVDRALISDTIFMSGVGTHQKAFTIGRRLNVIAYEVGFRVSGWGPISNDESIFLVR